MRSSKLFLSLSTLIFASAVATYAAMISADVIERRTETASRETLQAEGLNWVLVEADGLRLTLAGTAADEPERFRVLSAVAHVVEPSRIIDAMFVAPAEDIEAPEFRIEILRGESGVSLFGLIPTDYDRESIHARVRAIEGAGDLTDLLETADYPVPDQFDEALGYALSALVDLPRSKISVSAERVEVTALADSVDERRRLRSALARSAPSGLKLALEITAPRPVVTPYTLRFLIDGAGARFDACTADTEEARDQIVAAAVAAGMEGKVDCTIALGVPSPRWAETVQLGIEALAELERGSLTLSDADVRLVTSALTPQAAFDRVAGRLEADLPPVFTLSATRTQPEGEAASIPEFVATRSPEGQVQVRGLVADTLSRAVVEGLAQARFGVNEVVMGTRTAEDLPPGWSVRIMTGMEALAQLDHGSVHVEEALVTVRGLTGNQSARAEIARLLSEKLGDGEFQISVTYSEALDPLAQLPTPEECIARLNGVQAEAKITFNPGEATILAEKLPLIDRLAEAMEDCEDVPIEIAGHTDSQGRESMNLSLSQNRAEAIIDAMLARRVRVSNLTAQGYGEVEPIADNGTAEGREANRRIEFRLKLVDTQTAANDDETATDAEESTE